MKRRFFLRTLGCKLNQADTGLLASELEARGLEATTRPEEADLVVVNTCTVTHRADADGRRLLRRLRRLNPGARLVAMGCYARRDPRALEQIPGVDLVSAGSSAAPVVAEAERAFGAELTAVRDPYHSLPAATGRTRAFLKVQDGCNLTCSYCIIPVVRGRSRSLPLAGLVTSLQRLVDAGFVEVVLTGVNTGDYGKDLPEGGSLRSLLEQLCRVAGLGRLRLNSLEPRSLDPDLVSFLAASERIAPHLQIPLQSGSDRILKRMRRNYRRGFYLDLLESLEARIPDVGLGADVMVGFPGETDADFALTESLIRESPLAYLHVFSYSPRPGTAAAGCGETVPAAVIRERAARLRALGAAKAEAFRRQFVGRSLEAITLEAESKKHGLRALTGNFFEVTLPAGAAPGNRLVGVRILRVDPQGASGILAA